MAVIGQKVYEIKTNENGSKSYNIGVITDIYDQIILMQMKYGGKKETSLFVSELKESLPDREDGTILLFNNGKPAIAKKSIFGKYKI